MTGKELIRILANRLKQSGTKYVGWGVTKKQEETLEKLGIRIGKPQSKEQELLKSLIEALEESEKYGEADKNVAWLLERYGLL